MKKLFCTNLIAAILFSSAAIAAAPKLEAELFNSQTIMTVFVNKNDALRNFLVEEANGNDCHPIATLNSLLLSQAITGIWGPVIKSIPGGTTEELNAIQMNLKRIELIKLFSSIDSEYWLKKDGSHQKAFRSWGMRSYDMHDYLKKNILALNVPAYNQLAEQFNTIDYREEATTFEKTHVQVYSSVAQGFFPILQFGIISKNNGERTGGHAITVIGVSQGISYLKDQTPSYIVKAFDELQRSIVYLSISQAPGQKMPQVEALSPLYVYNPEYTRQLETLTGLFQK